MLTQSLRSKIFKAAIKPSNIKINAALDHLKSFGLHGKTTDIAPIDFNLPNLVSDTIESHFLILGKDQSDNTIIRAKEFAKGSIPPMPDRWEMNEGWTRYQNGATYRVPFPDDDAVVFDVEVLYKVSPFPVIACAVSQSCWYTWCMPGLFDNKLSETLVPLGNSKKIVIGHHVAYDRARIKNGQTGWVDEGALNSLADLASFYLNKHIDKSQRSMFAGHDLSIIVENFQNLMTYCAEDVRTTFQIYQVLLPKFTMKCPHPASFAGMLHMSKGYLPTNSEWNDYIKKCETLCNDIQDDIEKKLYGIAKRVSELPPTSYENSDWYKYLKWERKEIRMTKPKLNKDGKILQEARPYKGTNFETAGKPQWWVELWDSKEKKIRISLSKKCVPYLLQLKWNNYPLVHTNQYGWLYHTPKEIGETTLKDFNPIDLGLDPNRNYFRVPHPDGEGINCGNPLSKSFLKEFENGHLSSDYEETKELLRMKNQCIYWISSRNRIMSQFVVWDKDGNLTGSDTCKNIGIILPQTAVMGTVTRRATEPTWMTASNAKKNLIGSEIKSKIVAPPGYALVGADVDSEELWIASLIGDSQLGIHGGTAIGFMTLQGSKALGTDLHSNTGKIVNINRDVAKVFNYSRIYGAGVTHTAQLLCKHNPTLTKEEATKKAEKLFAETKGKKLRDRNQNFFWHGGSESIMFNAMERIAKNEDSRTPVLNCQIPNTLSSGMTGNSYLTSRVNWVVQSSGVDYLHLLLVSMDYLMKRLKIQGRFLLSIHDEIRYLVKEEDKYLAALALQISNLWTRAMFSSRLGFDDLPLEVFMDCVTPSNPTPIPPGESLDIYQLLDKVFGKDKQADIYGKELDSVLEYNGKQLKDILPNAEVVDESFLLAQMEKKQVKAKELLEGKSKEPKPPSNPSPKGMFKKSNKK
ncbi:DNA-directed DNA polymerase gamma mip1 [Boothiomyces sp. JEL0838]|nr:DNA-directed DNA polymerase gamma mip1 [Boothiomyces sp. JEL0838]KAJ3314204.1 DNA-directed DNA polymerase gamma mip1 [Boothiomyces sp. JEL0838]